MSLSLVTAPVATPVTLTEAKDYLRVDSSDENTLITSLISAATDYVESQTNRALVTQTWQLKLDAFSDKINLPKPNLKSITSIKYIDENGTEQTLAASEYVVDSTSTLGNIVLGYDKSWPSIRCQPNAITIEFVCGYGLAASVPEALKIAIKSLVALWYEQREPIAVGRIQPNIPHGVEALLWNYTIPGI